MISNPETIPLQRYIAIDLHKEYVFIGGMNDQQQWTLRPDVFKCLVFVIGPTRT